MTRQGGYRFCHLLANRNGAFPMSTIDEPRTKTLPPLIAGQRLDRPTFHERYEAMPPETRAELVGGVVYMPSPMRSDHGKEGRIVAGWMFHYQLKTPGVEGADGATVKLDQRGNLNRIVSSTSLLSWGGRSGTTRRVILPAHPSWSWKSPAQAAPLTWAQEGRLRASWGAGICCCGAGPGPDTLVHPPRRSL